MQFFKIATDVSCADGQRLLNEETHSYSHYDPLRTFNLLFNMKYFLLFLLVLQLISIYSAASVQERGDENQEFKSQTTLDLVNRFFRFRKLVEDKMEDGTIDKKTFSKPILGAFEKATDCFKVELGKFNSTIMKLVASVQKALTGQTATDTEGSGDNTPETPAYVIYDFKNPLEIMQKFGETFANFMSIFKVTNVQQSISDVKHDLSDAVRVSKDCFMAHLKETVPVDEQNLIVELWKQSEKPLPSDNVDDPTAGIKE